MLTAEEIREYFKMKALPGEGGYYAETYRSEAQIPKAALPARYAGDRAMATAIYYLLTPDTFSAIHRLKGDEIYHFYLGDPVELLQLKEDGTGKVIVLGQDLAAGMRLQQVVPGLAWQGSRLVPGGKYALLGTTMAPGFEFEDYEAGRREELAAAFPGYAALITALTR